jgi:uncharacterized protein
LDLASGNLTRVYCADDFIRVLLFFGLKGPKVDSSSRTCTAFQAERQLASGSYGQVALAVRALLKEQPNALVLIFDDQTGRQVDFDLRGSDRDVLLRLGGSESDRISARRPGRPKLGVVAREVTLLPRHWEWLGTQPGGASVVLRKLVEAARMARAGSDVVRRAQEAADRFMMAIAGNLPHYEEAARALYAGNEQRFVDLTASWPADLRAHARRLAAKAFADVSSTASDQ